MRHTVKLPDALSAEARHWAGRDGVSVDKWLTSSTQRECTRRGLVDYSDHLRGDSELVVEQVPVGDLTVPASLGGENEIRNPLSARRGEIWSMETPEAGTVLVISGDVYNDIEGYPYVLAVFLTEQPPRPPILVPVGEMTALVDSVRRVPKAMLHQRLGEVAQQELFDVEGALLRILTTN